MFAAVAVGILLGFWPGGLAAPKPAWWRWTAIVSMSLLVFFAFWLPTGGSFGGAAMVDVARGEGAFSPVLVEVVEANGSLVSGKDILDSVRAINISQLSPGDQSQLKVGERSILSVKRNSSTNQYEARSIVRMNPIVALPLLPALEERARNLYFHVPSAWFAELAWIVAVVFALRYLMKKERSIEDDVKASSAAAVGALFCVLATITGSVWAKFNWGSFWNWDPRQVSIFIVLLIYGSWFALRSAINSVEQRARVSSIYLILLVLPVTFFIFVYPRIQPGLHPGAEGSGTIGPVIDPAEIWLNPTKEALFSLAFFAFSLIFFWMVNLSIRIRLLDTRKPDEGELKSVTSRQEPVVEAIGSGGTRQGIGTGENHE